MHSKSGIVASVIWLSALFGSAARAQLLVVKGSDSSAERVERLLQFGGIPFRELALRELKADSLAGVRTVALLRAPLTPTAVSALRQFSAAGGKLVLIGQDAAPELFRAVGVDAAPAHPAR